LSKGTGKAKIPIHIVPDNIPPVLIDGPSCHPSVIFRKKSYIKAGGYRPEFYYGQDWDLWYRLGELGKFQMLDQVLYKARILPASVSACHKKKQDTIAKLSFSALLQRRKGISEQNILDKAGRIKPDRNNNSSSKHTAAWFYFIAECLRRNGSKRAISYFKKSLSAHPLFIKSWIRIFQATFIRKSN
jgi:hypothetical protein